jgi:DNA topoisomerase-2
VPKLKEMDDATIIKNFKLSTTISMTNYVLFTKHGKLFRFGNELDILKEFFNMRKELYEMRKDFMLAQLLKDYEIMFNKVKFI